MDREAKIYGEVGQDAQLTGKRLTFYVSYMERRWKETEEQKCKDGYAREWAIRFYNGFEYTASDGTGRRILRDIYVDHFSDADWMEYEIVNNGPKGSDAD